MLKDADHSDTPSFWGRFTALFGRSDKDDVLEPLNGEEPGDPAGVHEEEMSIFALSDEGVLPVDMDADSFMLDPIIESHIRENYNPAFTSLDNMMPVSAMYIKNLIVDEGLRGDMTTFAEIMTIDHHANDWRCAGLCAERRQRRFHQHYDRRPWRPDL